MASITLHNIDDTIYETIKEKAKGNNASINAFLKDLLNKTFNKQDAHSNFKEFSGVWDKKEFDEFERNTEDTKVILDEDWK